MKTLDFEDLLQDGKPSCRSLFASSTILKSYKFSTYPLVDPPVEVTTAINICDSTIRLPTHLAEKLSKIRTFSYRYMAEFGTNPTRQQLLEHVGMDDDLLSLPVALLASSRLKASIRRPLKTVQEIELQGF